MRLDGMPPCKDTKLSPEEQTQKNKELLEPGAKEVIPIPVSCDRRPSDVFKSASFICDFLDSSLRDIRFDKHADALRLFKLLVAHADRRKNEIIFSKCQFNPEKIPCTFFQKHPVKCQKVLDLLRAADAMYEHTPSTDHEGHYMTFQEMANSVDRKKFAKPNEHLPSKSLGKCETCPAWQFSSLTEAKRHVTLLHPTYKTESMPKRDQVFKCKHSGCNIVFATYHQLDKQSKEENHFVRKRTNEDEASHKSYKEKRIKTVVKKINTFFEEIRSAADNEVAVDDIQENEKKNN